MACAMTLDGRTRELVEHIYQRWSGGATDPDLSDVRDQILADHTRVQVHIVTLSAVAKAICPAQGLAVDSAWTAFFDLARPLELHPDPDDDDVDWQHSPTKPRRAQKRKRTDNAARRLRHLALICALWSLPLIEYYGWATAGNTQIRKIRDCALRWPCFTKDFCPRLNAVLLRRHCDALDDSHVRGIHESPLQLLRDFDLSALETADPDQHWVEQWTQNEEGDFAIDNAGRLLNELRPQHFRIYLLRQDTYGMLVPRSGQSWSSSDESPTPSAMHLSEHDELIITNSVEGDEISDIDAVGTLLLDDERGGSYDGLTTPRSTPSINTTDPANTTIPSQTSYLRTDAVTPEITIWDEFQPCTTQLAPDVHSPAKGELSALQSHRPLPPQPTINPADLSLPQHISDLSRHYEGPFMSEEAQPDESSISRVMSQTRSELYGSQEPQSSSSTNPISTDLSSSSVSTPQTTETPRIPVQSSFSQRGGESHSSREVSTTPGSHQRPQLDIPPPPIDVSIHCSDVLACSPEVHRQGNLSVAETLHNKYRSDVLAYIRMISGEALLADSSTMCKLRADWLTERTPWASIYAGDRISADLAGEARLYNESDMLYMSFDEFHTAALRNEAFDKPIIVTDQYSDSGMHMPQTLASQLADLTPDAIIQVTSLSHAQPQPMSIREFLKQGPFRKRSSNTYARSGKLENLTKAHRPRFTMLPRFRLLESLLVRALGWPLTVRASSLLFNAPYSTEFNILSTSGAFLGPQLHTISGTWIRNLGEAVVCAIVLEQSMSKSDIADFAHMGHTWSPHGTTKFFVLEQDAVFLIPPGLKIIYTIHCLTDSVIDGAMIWDTCNVIKTLRTIVWIEKNKIATDAIEIPLLRRMIDELCSLVHSDVDRFTGTLSEADFRRHFDAVTSDLKNLMQDAVR